jgi:predicted peroxiredoxin
MHDPEVFDVASIVSFAVSCAAADGDEQSGIRAHAAQAADRRRSLNIMMKSAWGSDDPTKAAFPFLHGLALAEAGHSVQIFLLGGAVGLMRKSEAEAVAPVGGLHWLRRWTRWRRKRSRSSHVARVLARGTWEKQIRRTTGESMAVRQSLWVWWSGRTA